MASAFTHAIAGGALALAMFPGRVGGAKVRIVLVAMVCAVLPDLDVAGFWLCVPYDAALGHRGLSHSLAVAALLALVVSAVGFRLERGRVWLCIFLVTASHGLFDAMTNGGLGVAFLAPFDGARRFLPFRPVEASPLSVDAFFDGRALPILASEALWIGLPWLLAMLGVAALSRRGRAR